MAAILRRIVIGVSAILLVLQWMLPVIMPLDEGVLEFIGPNINWIVEAALLIPLVLLTIPVLTGLTKKTFLLLVLGVLMDVGIGELTYFLGLPLYLDTLGSVLVGVILGPLAGTYCALISCCLWILYAPQAVIFAAVNILAGGLAGYFAKMDGFSNWLTTVVGGVTTGVAAGIIAAPLAYTFSHSPVNREYTDVFTAIDAVDLYFQQPMAWELILRDPLDKLLVFLLVFLMYPSVLKIFKFTPRPSAVSAR